MSTNTYSFYDNEILLTKCGTLSHQHYVKFSFRTSSVSGGQWKKMASKFDKSLEEIIREKGIQNPAIKKKKNQTQTPKFLKTISKKSYWQKIANEDGKTFEAPAKCSVKITGMVYLFHFAQYALSFYESKIILDRPNYFG